MDTNQTTQALGDDGVKYVQAKESSPKDNGLITPSNGDGDGDGDDSNGGYGVDVATVGDVQILP